MKIKAQQIRLGDVWYRVEYAEPVSIKQARKDVKSITKNFVEMVNILIESQFVQLKPDELEKLEKDLKAIEERLERIKKEYAIAVALKEARGEPHEAG